MLASYQGCSYFLFNFYFPTQWYMVHHFWILQNKSSILLPLSTQDPSSLRRKRVKQPMISWRERSSQTLKKASKFTIKKTIWPNRDSNPDLPVTVRAHYLKTKTIPLFILLFTISVTASNSFTQGIKKVIRDFMVFCDWPPKIDQL